MFSTEKQLKAKIGKRGTPRPVFLQDLVTEFVETNSIEYKEQIMANLANFAYDPVNYEYLDVLNVPDLFLDHLHPETVVNTEKIKEFALKGVLNLCGDETLRRKFIDLGAIDLVKPCLSSSHEGTVVSVLAILNEFLQPDVCSREEKRQILTLPVVDALLRLKADCVDSRVKNFATIVLEDHCGAGIVSTAVEVRKKLGST